MARRSSNIPNTPIARRRRIVELLAERAVKSQGQLEELLAADGLEVTQATVSRDLEELGAVKLRDRDGVLVYSVPSDVDAKVFQGKEAHEARLARLAGELVVAVEASAN